MDTKNSKSTSHLTKLQGQMAVAAFAAGVIIACICLFIVPPPGEISTSALSIVSELLILSGALLGVKVSVDTKLQQFMAQAKAAAKDPKQQDPEDEN